MLSKPVLSLGFTLIELMVTIAIAAILLGIAIPNFSAIVVQNRLTANANEFITALNMARSEAIKRGQHVVVRKTGTNWENGWQVFVDIDRSTAAKENVLDATTDIQLRVYQALPANFTLRGNTNFGSFITFGPNGVNEQPKCADNEQPKCADNEDFHNAIVLCHNSQLTTAKLITVNPIGRTRLGTDSDNNGIPENSKCDQNQSLTNISSCTTTSGF
ncbi:GspH/FimT family pseudopilin [Methylomonas sp. SURF-2]|uniref:Type II secretion system protein H n=1 Tax=Methylomonas subterranea TaxID=2952225 RepID=A0ABT1TIC2_9GAMM|nr:GspH/FimT family pseudopilin [Methylomonas sp. SURF-2]MCQ8105221.1 GspH/FimT family pseudopilin [Methylomonas sp. SURF-2]